VRCERRDFDDGTSGMIAVEIAKRVI